ncbi:MAG: glutaconyl-CoA/methylmalonyl-CoA decarboxylase subunit gamma [Candidatus Sumerlaeota bacterium]|nr:glutaconyl-CoA/methylmalonyl-CoA decarboxylase subunit gamma [Candidatus Sumerlaeota bacterium]
MKLRITVESNVYEVEVEVLEGLDGMAAAAAPAPLAAPARAASAAPAAAPAAAAPAAPKAAPAAAAGAKVFPSPLSGTVRTIKVKAGDAVTANQEVMILEAMKMETSIYAPNAGTVKAVLVKEGDTVAAGTGMIEFA